MNPDSSIKVVSQLLDLPIQDKDGSWCGIVDDVEFAGGAGKEAPIAALIVGPGAYKARMPGWMFAISRLILGDRIARVPIGEVDTIGTSVKLKCVASKLGLNAGDEKLRPWIPRWGAL
jgi:sporulation protein YlmC with PRC-barrel domain